jgi:hypothetical protein
MSAAGLKKMSNGSDEPTLCLSRAEECEKP